MIRFGAPTMVTLVGNKVYRMIWFGAPTMVTMVGNKDYRMIRFGVPQRMLLHPRFTRALCFRKVDLILASCSSTTIVYWFIMYLKTLIYLTLFGEIWLFCLCVTRANHVHAVAAMVYESLEA
ncbi:hypothetical protein Hdeb2414_s0003g00082481 [Helianthus debilis subsp. tardiflorus]